MTVRPTIYALLFWLGIGLVQIFNWGEAGPWKGMVLFALLLGALALLRAPATVPTLDRPPRWLVVLTTLLALALLVYASLRLQHPRLIDMATTTLDAGKTMLAGGNPYTERIDPELNGAYSGYKYLPLMPVAYMPLSAVFGERGVLITNMILQAVTALLMLRLGRETASPRASWLAVALYLSLPLAAQQLFAKGSTDLVATVPLLVGFAVFRRSDFAAGVCIGLSIAAKLFPGVAFAPCLLPDTWPARLRYALGIVAGLMPAIAYAGLDRAAFYDNIVLFNAIRPPDGTSWLAFAPAWAGLVARALFAVSYISALIYVLRSKPDLARRLALAAALTLGVILAAPTAHHNYMLWWLPFYALALAGFSLQKRTAAL